jgi:hypothetical protein
MHLRTLVYQRRRLRSLVTAQMHFRTLVAERDAFAIAIFSTHLRTLVCI